MKGSPIISTLLACFIMLLLYLAMQMGLKQNPTTSVEPTEVIPTQTTTVFAEIYFSTPPVSFRLSQPTTGKVILSEINDGSTEWSGEIQVPLPLDDLELNAAATWKTHPGIQFMQIVLSPLDRDSSSATLRSETDIDTTAHFHWHQH